MSLLLDTSSPASTPQVASLLNGLLQILTLLSSFTPKAANTGSVVILGSELETTVAISALHPTLLLTIHSSETPSRFDAGAGKSSLSKYLVLLFFLSNLLLL